MATQDTNLSLPDLEVVEIGYAAHDEVSEALLVSVITPTLNPGVRLQECIDCVSSQSYPSIEHIVVDGGSTDGTLEILASSSSLKWVSEKDRGQSQAMNKGFRMAGGQILTWLGADDLLTPHAVEEAVRLFLRDPNIDWVYGDTRFLTPSGEWTMRSPLHLSASHLEMGNVVAGVGVFLSAEKFSSLGYFEEAFKLSMDFDLWLRLLDAGAKSAHVGAILGIYRIHSGSKTGSIDRERFLLEQFEALHRSGRTMAAAMTLGRIAAWKAFNEGRVQTNRLRQEIENALELASSNMPGLFAPSAVRAASRTEAALLETPHRIAGLRHIFYPKVWVYPQTRKRLFGAFATGAKRVISRSGLRPHGVER